MSKECRTPKAIFTANKYCPGCGHGIVNRILAEVLEELGVAGETIISLAVGCACLLPESMGIDNIQAPHGRAPAVATGLKRVRGNKVIVTYQGDGDASAIGLAETMHAALRNEKITTIFVNNGVFGMTGGQMSPTTLPQQKTTTSLKGRDPQTTGMPIRLAEILSGFDVAYIARGAVISPQTVETSKKYIRNAIEAQINKEGYSFVEIISPCPTNWNKTPEKSIEHIKNTVLSYYPLGEIRQREEKR